MFYVSEQHPKTRPTSRSCNANEENLNLEKKKRDSIFVKKTSDQFTKHFVYIQHKDDCFSCKNAFCLFLGKNSSTKVKYQVFDKMSSEWLFYFKNSKHLLDSSGTLIGGTPRFLNLFV